MANELLCYAVINKRITFHRCIMGQHIKRTGIYKITNIVNGKCYIGSSIDTTRRYSTHKRELRNGTHHSPYLQNAWDLYGEESFIFQLLEECSNDKITLLTREQYYIDTVNPEYNICLIAGSRLGSKHSAETKKKISSSHLGKVLSDQHRQNLSESHKGLKPWNIGIPLTEEQKEKQRFAMKGLSSNKGRVPHNKGTPMSAEQKKKISDSTKGRVFSLETRNKLSLALKKHWNSEV